MSSPVLLGFLAALALVVGSVLMPVAHRLLRAHGIVDRPNHRSSHSHTPVRSGGLGCAVSVLVASVIAAAIVPELPVAFRAEGLSLPWSALAVVLMLSAVGLVDDVRTLEAIPRLLAQVILGAVLGHLLDVPWGVAIGALVVPICVNVINFMDGLNGITVATVGAWAVIVLIATGGQWSTSAMVAALALGTALAFLPWNLPTAHMFLGDSGSYLFGGLVATGILASVGTDAVSGVNPLVLTAPLALYFADTFSTLVIRARGGADILSAHREHLYQLLVNPGGWSHSSVSVSAGILSLLCGAMALLLPGIIALPAIAATACLVVVLGRRALRSRQVTEPSER